mgnify:FL=1
MILEVAILNIQEGAEIDFENDFKNASKFISAINGYINHSLSKCIEQKNKYLLLVNWESLNDHTLGFSQSKEYLEWKRLLHPYYDPFPIVEHYDTIYKNT